MKKILSFLIFLIIFLEADITSCISCHGKHFEKKAFGQSKIVQDMNETAIEKALKGYKEGTYGSTMKGIMENQMRNKTNLHILANEVFIVSHENNVSKKRKRPTRVCW